MVKNKKREMWTLKVLRYFYYHQHYMFHKYRMLEEDRVPGLRSIEEVNMKFDETGLFFRDYDRDYHHKRL
jgi:hypothetical protein